MAFKNLNNSIEIDDEEIFLNNDKVLSIVNYLTKNKVKLWEMPNFSEKLDSQPVCKEFIMKLSDEIGLVEEEVKHIVIRLQKHANSKLSDNKKLNQEGIAVFKLKIIGNNNQNQKKSFNKSIEISINSTGNELKSFIISNMNLNCDNLKIICNGKVIKEDFLLSSQDIKNHSTFLIICVYDGPVEELSKTSADFKLISDIKEAVSLLTSEKIKKNELNQFSLQNQNGISLDISNEDKNSLATAMILHEKGKILIKSKEYIKALILLSESGNEFRNCQNKQLLDRVDNYALLNLDIVWCYLCLQNLQDLKNAEESIEMCEACLKKCYGTDLERLTKLKTNDSVNKHIPIFVRLNLLKAILNYHKGKKKEAKIFLDIAREELNKIIIDEEKLTELISMGFDTVESRLALRGSSNNLDAAIEKIFEKKKLLKEAEKLEKEKNLNRRLEKEYGRTKIGNKPLQLNTLKSLKELGYSEQRAAKALIDADNDFNLALDLLQSKFEQEIVSTDEAKRVDDLILTQLISLGYEKDLSRSCLETFNNNIQEAIEFLCTNKNDLNDLKALKEKLEQIKSDKNEYNNPKTSKEDKEKQINAKKMIEKIAFEMPDDNEAYLDFNLDEDAFYINKYYSLLE